MVQKWSHDGQAPASDRPPHHCDGPCGETASLNSADVNQPADIAVDPLNGDVYIADGYGNHRIVVFNRRRVPAAMGFSGRWAGPVLATRWRPSALRGLRSGGAALHLRSRQRPHPGVRQVGNLRR